ncbi:MAG: casein kinase 1 family protein [archaeon]|nr:casein kinase 1 family protein [archaeon]
MKGEEALESQKKLNPTIENIEEQVANKPSEDISEKELKEGHSFQVIKNQLIGAGAFSSVYLGKDNTLKGLEVAIKIEKNPPKHINFEAKVLKYLQGGIGIPKYFDFFSNELYSFLIMEKLSQDIKSFIKTQPKILESALINISMQMLTRLEFLHNKGFIHRDIKPDNFCLGSSKSNTLVYLIDFGLCKRYLTKEKTHIEFSENEQMIGTPKYASINSHLEVSLSRRDDLESLAYTIIFLFRRGSLPWDKVKALTLAEKNNKIMDLKIQTPEEDICQGLHQNLVKFLRYTKQLKFEETPDYKYLYNLLKEMYAKK